MTSKTVKCKTCNIVIDEVLAFVQNKLDVMDVESLIRICATGFSTSDIQKAKTLLFESVPSTGRKITRKKEGKRQRDLEDIIKVFQNVDPEEIPIFVAKELHKLPPVTFDHVDVTRILKDITTIQNEMRSIKESYCTSEQFEQLKYQYNLHLRDLHCKDFPDSQVNKKRGAAAESSDWSNNSVPMNTSGIEAAELPKQSPNAHSHSMSMANLDVHLHTSSPSINKRNVNNCGSDKITEPVAVASPVLCAHERECAAGTAGCASIMSNVSDNQRRECTASEIKIPNVHYSQSRTAAEVLQSEGKWKEEVKDEKWILVQRKRLANRFIGKQGKGNSEGSFRAAVRKMPLFISNVDVSTKEKDIEDYIREKTDEVVTLEKISMKQGRGYNAFKFFIPIHKVDLFLNEHLWPEGITFRKFVRFQYRKNEISGTDRQSANAPDGQVFNSISQNG